jgi:RHS repeat-associated protein
MTPARCLRILVGLITFSAGSAFAQVPTGTPPFGTFASNSTPDVIDLANLNSHFAIPVIHKAGRGIDFTYDLSYDSSVWYPVTSGSTKTWQPVYNWGWRGVTEVGTGYVSYTTTITTLGPTWCRMWTYSNWVYHDPWGVRHPFNGSVDSENDDANSTCGTCFYSGYCLTGLTSTSSDGSGYTLTVPDSATIRPSHVNLYGREGKLAVPTQNTGTGAASSTDRNGNYISVDNSGNFYDTLSGTTPVLTVAGLGTPSSPTTFAYTAPSGAAASYKMNYTNYTVATNFGVSLTSEYKSSAAVPLVTSIVLPDNSQYTIQYEPTPSTPSPGACTPYAGTTCVTARIKSVTLPTGGSITYTYTGGSNGVFADGTTSGLSRVLSDGASWNATWAYARTPGTGAASTDTITDPLGNQTVMQFQGIYQTQRQVYQGTSTLLQTVYTCYNGSASPCTGTALSLPIGSQTVTTILPGSFNLQSKIASFYNTYGQLSEEDDYDYGSGGPGSLLRKKLITIQTVGTYQAIQTAKIQDGIGTTLAQTTMTFDQGSVTTTSGTPQHTNPTIGRGNPTTISYMANSSTSVYKTLTFYDTGNVKSITDVGGGTTSYNYPDSTSTCGNSFPTSVTEPLSLSQSMVWNCTGGVETSATDENGKVVSMSYADTQFWRPNAATDQVGNQTTFYYQPNPTYATPFEVASYLTFNNGNSVVSDIQYKDGLGRTYVDQHWQMPSSSTLDSVSFTYDAVGRQYSVSMPCSVGYGGTCSSPQTTQTYDALNRPLQTNEAGGGTLSRTYSQNDVLVTIGPAPSGENTKRKQLEYDALGRLTSVCEITAGTTQAPAGTCSQNTPVTGYWTKYSYDANGNLKGVTQNAQATSGQQTRGYSYDGLSRMTSEANPETGMAAVTYTYDFDSACGTYGGDLVKKTDPVGNTVCYSYDVLHRVTSTTYAGTYASATPNKYFVYDTATVNGVAMSNAKTRLAEAYTTGPISIQNANFEASSSLPPPGWTANYATLSYDTTSQYSGTRSLKTAPTALYGGVLGTVQAGVAGKQYTMSGYVKGDGVCYPDIQLMFLNSSLGYVGGAQAAAGTPTSWTYVTATATAPAGTVYIQASLQNQTAGGAGVCEFDNISASSNASSTDLGLSYTARGEVSDEYESTPNSGGYYHSAASYWANGVINTLSGTGGYGTSYGVDGEGRIYSAGGGSELTSTTYNTASQPTAVNFASGDSDNYIYDPNTGRMTQYKFNVNGQSAVGTLAWNAIGTLGSLGITDPFNASNAQSCTYTHDDLIRILTANCGSIWSQTFTYADAFGNLTKSGNSSFSASYSPSTNRMTTIGSSTPTYDANGNVTNDFLHTYSWDAEGRPISIDGLGLTYDALGRNAEMSSNGVYTGIQYSPTGFEMQLLHGQTLVKAFVPMPAGTAEVWTPSANYYRHSDWLGSARLTSNQNRTIYGDVAYAPFGETYAQSGTADASFTGMNQDMVTNEYDFPAREYGIQGRWPSPDPLGVGAVDLGNPQSWNRYAYVGNNPLGVTDPTGMGPELGGICATNPIACAVASVLEGLFFFFGHHHHHPTPQAAPAPPGGYGAGIDPYGTWDESLPAGVQVFPSPFPGMSGAGPSGCTYGSGNCGGMIYGVVNIQGGQAGPTLNDYGQFTLYASVLGIAARDAYCDFGGDAVCRSGQSPRAVGNIQSDNATNFAVAGAIEATAESGIFDAFQGINNNPLLRVGPGYKQMPDGTVERIWRFASGGRWGKGGFKLPWHWHWP